MALATVTVKFINQPKEGKKEGSIRVQDDSFYGVPPALLAQFQPGGTYEVEYTTREWQGKTFKSVKSAKAVGAAPAGFPGFTGTGGHDKDTPMRIFICGAYNNAIQAGQLNILNEDDCLKAVEIQKRVWRQTLSGEAAAKQAKAEEFNDAIPY